MLPATLDVATYLSARTKPRLGGGDDTGDFSENTVPTALAVTGMIEKAGRYVRTIVGDYADIEAADADLFATILDVVALRAAADVERSYRPEQARATGSLHEQLRSQFDTDLKALTGAVREFRSSGSVSSGDGCLPLASGISDTDAVELREEW